MGRPFRRGDRRAKEGRSQQNPFQFMQKLPVCQGLGRLLIAILAAGVVIHAAEKQLLIIELQKLEALLWVEGDDAALGVHPDAPGRWGLSGHSGLLLSRCSLFYAIIA